MRRSMSLAVAALLLGCGGGAAAATPPATAASSGGDTEEPSEHHHRRSHHGSHGGDDAADEHAEADEEFPLDAIVEVPGTGVSMRAPRGSARSPVGAGFIHERRRVQILVAVAHGAPELMAGFEASLSADAEEVESEDVTIGERTGHLVIDTQDTGQLELERVWVLVRDGDRAMAIVGAYQSDRSERLRGLVRASVLSALWDADATIDPERAVGFRLTPPDGLVAEPQVVNTLTYTIPGGAPSPSSGQPALLVVPIPIQVPATERDDYCEQILLQAGPVSEDSVVSRAEIATETMEGCEVFGTQEITTPTEGGPSALATYAALVFLENASFMVAGFVDARERDTWTPRFSAAARTVGPVAR